MCSNTGAVGTPTSTQKKKFPHRIWDPVRARPRTFWKPARDGDYVRGSGETWHMCQERVDVWRSWTHYDNQHLQKKCLHCTCTTFLNSPAQEKAGKSRSWKMHQSPLSPPFPQRRERCAPVRPEASVTLPVSPLSSSSSSVNPDSPQQTAAAAATQPVGEKTQSKTHLHTYVHGSNVEKKRERTSSLGKNWQVN